MWSPHVVAYACLTAFFSASKFSYSKRKKRKAWRIVDEKLNSLKNSLTAQLSAQRTLIQHVHVNAVVQLIKLN